MSFILPAVNRQAAKEVGVQIQLLRATGLPDARCSERVLHVRVSESPVYLASAQRPRVCLPVGWEGLIATSDTFELSGGVQTRAVAEAALVKLQVFIDLGNTLVDQRPGPTSWAALPVAYPAVWSGRVLERWYIEQAMVGGMAYQTFAGVLRHTESYGLVRFLLELSLTELGENTQVQLVNAALGMMMMLIYFPFIWSCSQRDPEPKPAAQSQA